MKKNLLQLMLLLFPILSFSQSNVKFIVTDAGNKTTLIGATVVVAGTSNGAASDVNGIVTLKVNPTDIVEVSMLGYQKQSIAINNRTQITVTMQLLSLNLTEVVVVGSRRMGRIKSETTVPVDLINVSQMALPTGRMDLTSLLNYSAPSLNANKQSGSDGADHVDLATLRGLGPDQTLVLVNGKRRHQTAFVALFGTRGRGNSGTDLNTIPLSAIDHVEILRDGASAQYGSDAIAGVINLVLKKNVKEFSGDVGYAGYYDKKYNPSFTPEFGQYETGKKVDGKTITFNGNYGVPLGKNNGFVNFSLNVTKAEKTFRQVLDTSNLTTTKNSLPINVYRRGNGDASSNAVGGFFNLELPLKNKTTVVYGFGGYNTSFSDAFAFSRNYSAKPERFPTDANGNLIYVSDIMHVNSDKSDTFFDPHIQTNINDISFAAGVRGKTHSNWNWDVSNNTGRNDFHFYGDKTFNASLGAGKTNFDDGGFSFLQNTSNLNFTKEIAGIAQGFNLAIGAEYRYEQYNLYAGEVASYKNYDTSGTKASGSQGFPGYQPNDEVKSNRSTGGVYVDAEMDVTKKFLVAAAIRVENYSDFGLTTNFKLSSRYKLTNKLNVRGSVSTGYRAPSLQQINFSSTFTTVQGGKIAEVKIAPNYSPITKAAGIPDLKQEESVNAGLGFTYSPLSNFNITVDGYMVKVKNRVVLSGQFDASDATLDTALTNTLKNLNASLAQFFANAVNTTNTGVDIVMEYRKVTERHTYRAMLAGNIQHMTIDQVNVPTKLNDTEGHRATFLSDREKNFILASAPTTKFALTLEYSLRRLTIGTRATYFGKVTLLGYGDDGLGIDPKVPTDADANVRVRDEYVYGGKLVNDLYLTYKLHKAITICIGADNILGVHPDLGAVQSAKGWAFNNEPAGPWDAVQMGSNGMRLYARIGFTF